MDSFVTPMQAHYSADVFNPEVDAVTSSSFVSVLNTASPVAIKTVNPVVAVNANGY